METKCKTISELIEFLKKCESEFGDLPISREYDGEYWIGATLRDKEIHDPDNYSKKIRTIHIY